MKDERRKTKNHGNTTNTGMLPVKGGSAPGVLTLPKSALGLLKVAARPGRRIKIELPQRRSKKDKSE
jgi:hypothetical protein